ncbi:IS66 family transposase [Rhodoblastus acidophilus]|uniref:IS66 family transposase n=1 Tax=Rhodoblastus acidophilus TaxID=1074 RepID=UPI0016230211|nr:transposase [Rhodoblastus acidophilus]
MHYKGFQALSYERLRLIFRDAFGLCVSEGALGNMFIRTHARFKIEVEKAKAVLRAAREVASDETGVRIEGANAYHWVFHCKDAVVHQPDYSRAARVVKETMGGHRPQVWISERYSAQQSHGQRHQTCLAHLARDAAFALEHGSDDSSSALQALVRPMELAAPEQTSRSSLSVILQLRRAARVLHRRDTQ